MNVSPRVRYALLGIKKGRKCSRRDPSAIIKYISLNYISGRIDIKRDVAGIFLLLFETLDRSRKRLLVPHERAVFG